MLVPGDRLSWLTSCDFLLALHPALRIMVLNSGQRSEVRGQRTENNFEFRIADCEFGICEGIEHRAWGMENQARREVGRDEGDGI